MDGEVWEGTGNSGDVVDFAVDVIAGELGMAFPQVPKQMGVAFDLGFEDLEGSVHGWSVKRRFGCCSTLLNWL